MEGTLIANQHPMDALDADDVDSNASTTEILKETSDREYDTMPGEDVQSATSALYSSCVGDWPPTVVPAPALQVLSSALSVGTAVVNADNIRELVCQGMPYASAQAARSWCVAQTTCARLIDPEVARASNWQPVDVDSGDDDDDLNIIKLRHGAELALQIKAINRRWSLPESNSESDGSPSESCGRERAVSKPGDLDLCLPAGALEVAPAVTVSGKLP